MIGVHDLPLFVVAGLVLNLTPGPDMAYIAARGAIGGFRAGAAATFGITAGCVVHTLAAAMGLSVLLATSATAFAIVKWLGAAYLLYAGMRLLLGSLRARHSVSPQAPLPPAGSARIFREALVINVLNPKVALFFLAFLPQFVDPQRGAAVIWQLGLMGLSFTVVTALAYSALAWSAGSVGARLARQPRIALWLERATGAVFLLMAARLAFAERK